MSIYINPNKLYIIGNGFDIHHKMKCSYGDFKDWLLAIHPVVYNNLERLYGTLDGKWWSSFEMSLADIDTEEYPKMIIGKKFFDLLHDFCKRYGDRGRDFFDDFQLRYPNSIKSEIMVKEMAGFEMDCLKEDLSDSFGEWVREIELPDKLKKLKNIDIDALFFTFNYTRTLEDVYGIDKDQVVHLHGSVDNGEFVFGHSKSFREILERDFQLGIKRDPTKDIGEDGARLAMMEVVNGMRKPVREIIEEHRGDFNLLGSIDEIEVLGFSYSPVDLPYLDRIIMVTGKEVAIKFGWHCKDDMNKAMQYAQDKGLTNYRLYRF